MADSGWVIVCKEMNPYVAGRSRVVARICPLDQTAGKVQGGKLQIVLRDLISEGLIVELPNGSLEVQAPSPTFSGMTRGPYRSYPELQREIERYTGCPNCQMMDLA